MQFILCYYPCKKIHFRHCVQWYSHRVNQCNGRSHNNNAGLTLDGWPENLPMINNIGPLL